MRVGRGAFVSHLLFGRGGGIVHGAFCFIKFTAYTEFLSIKVYTTYGSIHTIEFGEYEGSLFS